MRLADGLAAGAVVSLALVTGCATERTRTDAVGRPMPIPQPAPETPELVRPDTMLLVVGQRALDSNANGYPDQLNVTVALFNSEYPSPVEARGAFIIRVFEQGDSLEDETDALLQWRFEPDEVAAKESVAMYGRCYQLPLDMLELGTDVLRPIHGNVAAEYVPTDGGPAVRSSRELRPVRLGRQAR